jgi:putative ATP-binding cassette transporter
MFLVGALGGVVQNIPAIAQANASAEELFQLEEKLNKIKVDDNESEEQNPPVMQTLELRNVIYHYDEAKNQTASFVLGPISYTFEAGKIYFVRGNNGSGKSTLIRILIGLYEPSAGGLYVNGDLVEQPSTLAYRNLFSVVFSDFYLFKKLYGIYLADDEVVDAAIDLLDMGDKIKIENRVISDIHLSTGQKKRIALITAILEDRQVIVLDEWASDQDPEFRKHFYQFILPELQRRGKTIIAITHDDQYYNLSDSIFEISKGVLINTK